MRNANEIMIGIDNLNEPVTNQLILLPTEIDATIRLSKDEDNRIEFNELLEDLEKYGRLAEIKQVHFKS
jgi:hypothetical protein